MVAKSGQEPYTEIKLRGDGRDFPFGGFEREFVGNGDRNANVREQTRNDGYIEIGRLDASFCLYVDAFVCFLAVRSLN